MPPGVERALRSDFSAAPSIAQRQRIALAHIEAEKELEPVREGAAGVV